MKHIFVCLVVLLALNTECLADQLTGTVKSRAGQALKGVRVYSRGENQFANEIQEYPFLAVTDEQGRFKLLAHGRVVFFRLLGYQPTIKILEDNLNSIDIVLEDAVTREWNIPSCSDNLTPGSFIGPDKLGFKIPIPANTLTDKQRGDHDTYYTIYHQKREGAESLVYTSSWMVLGFPREELILASNEYSIRPFSHGKYGGIDLSGRTKDGKYWRFVGSDGTEISYENASKEAAGYFDGLINGMCIKQ